MTDQGGHDGTDQGGHDGPQHDVAAVEAAGREDVRLLMITFAGSLAAILAGTIMLGLSLAFLRLYHKLPGVFQGILDGTMPVAILFGVAIVPLLAKESNMKRIGGTGMGWPWKVVAFLYLMMAMAGVLFFTGLAAGLK